MQSLAATSRAQLAPPAGRPASRAAQAVSIPTRCTAAGAARQRQQGGTSLPPPPPAAAATLRSRRRAARCQAAAESDIIDVEGKVIDDRVPVTVRAGRGRLLWAAGRVVARRRREATTGRVQRATPTPCIELSVWAGCAALDHVPACMPRMPAAACMRPRREQAGALRTARGRIPPEHGCGCTRLTKLPVILRTHRSSPASWAAARRRC